MNQQNEEQRVALITGSARRIGKHIAIALHQAGFRVIIHYRHSAEEANALAWKLNQERSGSACALAADLMLKNSLLLLIEEANKWWGRLDLLVNNASVFMPSHLKEQCDADWDVLFTANVKAPFWLSLAAFPYLEKTQGSIVNITDIHADKPLKGYSLYCQSKAALVMQTKSLAREFAPKVRVNAIAPGAIMWPEGENALSESIKEKIMAQTPLKRHGEPQFIANAVLALSENPFITGQVLAVDGGRSLL